jgi:hypothetical protein
MSRTWDLTINNYSDAEVELVKSWSTEVNRLVASFEVSESGTPHIQARMTFKRVYRLSALKKLCPRAHWSKTLAKQDSLYVMKEGSEVFVNVDNRRIKDRGTRNDLHDFKEAIKAGAADAQLWEEHFGPMAKYSKSLEVMRTHLCPKPSAKRYEIKDFKEDAVDLKLPVIMYGKPGLGKTQYALAHFLNPLLVRHMDDLKKLTPLNDGLVFDDMDFNHVVRSTQIYLCDELESSIHCRFQNATLPAGIRRIFTTNREYGAIFDLNDEAISRRCNVIEIKDNLF